MKKVLISYYSRSGHTEKLVTELASTLGADLEKIVDLKNRKGILGFILGGKDATQKKLTSIQPTKYNPKDYDVVILASPTWASTIAPAIRTYVEQQKANFNAVAFLVSQGGGCNGKIYNDLEAITEKSPISTVDFSANDIKSDKWKNKLSAFGENFK